MNIRIGKQTDEKNRLQEQTHTYSHLIYDKWQCIAVGVGGGKGEWYFRIHIAELINWLFIWKEKILTPTSHHTQNNF